MTSTGFELTKRVDMIGQSASQQQQQQQQQKLYGGIWKSDQKIH